MSCQVILSACSNTFKSILKETEAPHPVIVLWDIEARDVSALLDFMYNGQVDMQQDDLERFLIVADRLQVRGLSGEETESAEAARTESQTGRWRGGSNSDHVVTLNHQLDTGDLDIKTEVMEDGNGDFCTVEEFYDDEVDISPGRSSKSVKCPYCEKVLKYRHNLKGHIQNQHGAGEPEAPCPICPDKIFKNSASLRDHMSRKHRGEKAAAAAQQQQQQLHLIQNSKDMFW